MSILVKFTKTDYWLLNNKNGSGKMTALPQGHKQNELRVHALYRYLSKKNYGLWGVHSEIA